MQTITIEAAAAALNSSLEEIRAVFASHGFLPPEAITAETYGWLFEQLAPTKFAPSAVEVEQTAPTVEAGSAPAANTCKLVPKHTGISKVA